MPRLCLLFVLAAIAGCGSNPESRVAGTWQADPATITISRLLPGAEKRPDWTDAIARIGGLTVTFSSTPNSVTASGLDEASTGSWALRGDTIEVQGKGDHWPQMTLDAHASVIHAVMEQGGDKFNLDLVKKQ